MRLPCLTSSKELQEGGYDIYYPQITEMTVDWERVRVLFRPLPKDGGPVSARE